MPFSSLDQPGQSYPTPSGSERVSHSRCRLGHALDRNRSASELVTTFHYSLDKCAFMCFHHSVHIQVHAGRQPYGSKALTFDGPDRQLKSQPASTRSVRVLTVLYSVLMRPVLCIQGPEHKNLAQGLPWSSISGGTQCYDIRCPNIEGLEVWYGGHEVSVGQCIGMR